MKTERWYDIKCDECCRYLSTDFKTGMASDSQTAIKWAKSKGFKDVDGRTLCPYCAAILKIKKARENRREDIKY